MARLLDEAKIAQLLKGLIGGVLGQTAFARGVANGEFYSPVVEAVVSEADLDVDCAGWRGKRPPGVGFEHVVMEGKVAVFALLLAVLLGDISLPFASRRQSGGFSASCAY